MGANFVLNPQSEDPVKNILEATDGTGVDVLLEMSGHPAAIQQGFKALRAGGRASLLGIPTENVPLELGARRNFQRRYRTRNLRTPHV